MTYAIVGGRDFDDYEKLKRTLDKYDIGKIVSGGAKGADILAEQYAEEMNIEIKVFYPEWDKFGKGAGFIRNETIVENADIIVAFWDFKSNGTKNTIQLAKRAEKKVIVIDCSTAAPLF